MIASTEPPEDERDDSPTAGITRSEHARLRSGQGRPIAEVVNDIQRANPRDVFVQPDDGRYVVRGPRGREHVIEENGEHVTSVRRPEAAHQARLRDRTIRATTEDDASKLADEFLTANPTLEGKTIHLGERTIASYDLDETAKKEFDKFPKPIAKIFMQAL